MMSGPKQPSAEEQYATQQRLQEQAQTDATKKSELERRKATLETKRKKSNSSLITSRTGGLGLLGDDPMGNTFDTLYPKQ